MQDFLGTELGPGDKVVYPIRNGGTLKNERGIVTGYSQRGDSTCVVVLRTDYGDVVQGHHNRPELLTVVGTVPVIDLETLLEAFAIAKVAKHGYFGHTVSLDAHLEAQAEVRSAFEGVWR